MRLFIFLPQLPYPARSGGRIVTAPLIEGLAKRHEVHLFSLTHGFEGEAEGKERVAKIVESVTTEPGTKRVEFGPLAASVFSRDPYKVHRFWNPELSKAAAALARKNPPDAIHCQNFYTARYARGLTAPKKVLYKENFETALLDRWVETTPKRWLRPLIRLERARTLRFEIESASWFDRVATISPRDRTEFLRAAPQLEERVSVVRPSIDVESYDPALVQESGNPFPSDSSRKNIVFTGSFNYLANADGADWMVNEVLPKLDAERYALWLVGQHPGPETRARHNPPFVNVTGSVPDVKPYLRSADASLVPLRIGGGIRLKILESLALGCPLVSTSVGCEGLWSEEDPALWRIADDPERFARSVEEAIADKTARDELRGWVVDRFSPERFIREMEDLYGA